MKRNRIKIIVIVVAIIAVIGVIAVFVYNILKSATLSILVAPSDATIMIDGKEYKNGVYKFFPTEGRKVVVSRAGYRDQELVIDLLANETTPLMTILEDEQGGYKSYLENLNEYELMRMVALATNNTSVDSLIDETSNTLKIQDILPVNYTSTTFILDQHGFSIPLDNGVAIQIMASDEDCGVIPCLDVYVSDGDLEKAKDYILSQGYNPEDYRFIEDDKWLYDPPIGQYR